MPPAAAPGLGFSFQAGNNGSVRIFRDGAVVTTLRGAAARQFLARVEGKDAAAVQAAAARITGNYARGNEGVARRHPRNGGPR